MCVCVCVWCACGVRLRVRVRVRVCVYAFVCLRAYVSFLTRFIISSGHYEDVNYRLLMRQQCSPIVFCECDCFENCVTRM